MPISISEQASAELSWDRGVPVSRQFDDVYYSILNGPAEVAHVFLRGNDLPARWRMASQFAIGELGFGTGLNLIETAALFLRSAAAEGHLTYVSFEKFPLTRADMDRAAAWRPLLAPLYQRLTACWPPNGDLHEFDVHPRIHVRLYIGDANTRIQGLIDPVDTWFLDGFAPAKNPDLWGEQLLRNVAERTSKGGRASSYTSAGWVRRNLQSAGFTVERIPGFGRKRQMIRARRD